MRSVAAFLILSLPLVAVAKDATPDTPFYKDAAEAGLAEVKAGKLASTHGASADVKEFGAMMVKDHGAANKKLAAIASTKGVKMPTEPGLMHKASEKILKMKSGDSFDKSYIEGQIKDHEATVDLLKKEIANGQDPDAKAFASEVLPKVEMHLEKIRSIATAHGVSQG